MHQSEILFDRFTCVAIARIECPHDQQPSCLNAHWVLISASVFSHPKRPSIRAADGSRSDCLFKINELGRESAMKTMPACDAVETRRSEDSRPGASRGIGLVADAAQS
jgi:hypothetical protein